MTLLPLRARRNRPRQFQPLNRVSTLTPVKNGSIPSSQRGSPFALLRLGRSETKWLQRRGASTHFLLPRSPPPRPRMKPCFLLLFAFALLAPAAAQIGRRFPSEKKVVPDPVTGLPLT